MARSRFTDPTLPERLAGAVARALREACAMRGDGGVGRGWRSAVLAALDTEHAHLDGLLHPSVPPLVRPAPPLSALHFYAKENEEERKLRRELGLRVGRVGQDDDDGSDSDSEDSDVEGDGAGRSAPQPSATATAPATVVVPVAANDVRAGRHDVADGQAASGGPVLVVPPSPSPAGARAGVGGARVRTPEPVSMSVEEAGEGAGKEEDRDVGADAPTQANVNVGAGIDVDMDEAGDEASPVGMDSVRATMTMTASVVEGVGAVGGGSEIAALGAAGGGENDDDEEDEGIPELDSEMSDLDEDEDEDDDNDNDEDGEE